MSALFAKERAAPVGASIPRRPCWPKRELAGFPYESVFPDLQGPAEAIGIGALIRIAGRRRADHELTGIPGFPQLVHFTS